MTIELVARTPIAQAIARGPAGPSGNPPEHEIDGPQIRFRQSNGEWSDWINMLGPEGPSGDAQNFENYAIAQASSISIGVNVIRLEGYATAGDLGGASYA